MSGGRLAPSRGCDYRFPCGRNAVKRLIKGRGGAFLEGAVPERRGRAPAGDEETGRMANTVRRDRPLLGYFGGLLAAIVLCAAALVALAVLRPVDEASAPEAPAQAEEEAAALPEQETPDEEVAATAPEEAPSGPSRPEPVPQPSAGGNPELRNVPEPGPLPSDGGFASPEPFEAPGGDGQIGDLATLPGGPSLAEPGASPALTVPTVEGPALQLDGPALEVN